MSDKFFFEADKGLRTFIEISDDGSTATISKELDSSTLQYQLDFNTKVRNELDGYFVGSKRGLSSVGMKKVAHIPDFVCEYWRHNLGVDVYSQDPDMKAKAMALLDDPDWSSLRTSEGMIGKKQKWA